MLKSLQPLVTDASVKKAAGSSLCCWYREGSAATSPSPSLQLLITAAVSVLAGGFHFGFQMAIMNPMAAVLQHFLMTAFERRYHMPMTESFVRFAWSALAGSLFIGAAVGAWAGASLVQWKGAAKGVLSAALLLFFAIALSGFAYLTTSSELFVLSRLSTGVGIGIGMTAHGVLLTEISPVSHRGLISSFGGFSTNIGFILASFLGLPDILGQAHRWHLAYFIAAAPCVLVIGYFCFFAHESPVFLVRTEQIQAASRALTAYSPDDSPDHRIAEIRNELHARGTAATIREILTDVASRRALNLSVVLNVTVSFSGIIAMSFFGTFLLKQIGFSERSAAIANCLASLAGTAGAITATLAVDRVGRRLLVIGSLLLLALINTLMMSFVLIFEATEFLPLGHAFLLLFVAFLFIFSAGAGPAAWFIGAELAPTDARPRIQAASIGAQYLTCFLSPIVYFPLQRTVGAYSFLLFVVPLSLASVYFFHSLPETKGRHAEEISEDLRRGRREKNADIQH